MNCAAGVVEHLNGFEAGQLVEKPSAARVHEHGVALHFEKFEGANPLLLVEIMRGVLREEAREAFVGAVEDYINIGIAGSPGIFQKGCGLLLEKGRQSVAKPIERFAEGRAPALVPIAVAAGIAATVGFPALDAVNAAPGRVFHNFDKMVGRIHFEELPVVDELRLPACLDAVKRVAESHLAAVMMVAVALTVGGDMGKLWPGSGVGEAAHEAIGETFSVG